MAKWREFEQLVERIERHSLPPGATIKSPDRIRCTVTGELREVDVSIQLPTSRGVKLITIECRDRARTEDVTWIEQLVTKKRNIGAVVTIAITSKRFTDTAIRMAANYGILVRTIDEIDDEEIDSWVGNVCFRLIGVVNTPLSVGLIDVIWRSVPTNHIPALLCKRIQENKAEPFLFGEVTGRRESIDSLIRILVENEYPTNMSKYSVPHYPQMTIRKTRIIELNDDWYFVIGAANKIQIRAVRLSYSLTMMCGEGTVFKVIQYGDVDAKKTEYSLVQLDYEDGTSSIEAFPRSSYELLAKARKTWS